VKDGSGSPSQSLVTGVMKANSSISRIASVEEFIMENILAVMTKEVDKAGVCMNKQSKHS